jgi:uncharacterized protein GlcG (DUF336 family)
MRAARLTVSMPMALPISTTTLLPDSRTDLAGVELVNTQDNLWGGVGIGGTYSWADDKYALHGEAHVNTSLANFASSYSLAGTAGLTVRF